MRARYLDPATGQFLTVDPLVEATRTPYLYGDGDPVDRTDPTGASSFLSGVGNGLGEFAVGTLTGIGGMFVDPAGTASNIVNGLSAVYENSGGGLMGQAAVFDQFNPVYYATEVFGALYDGATGATSAQGAGCAATFGLLQVASMFAPGAAGGLVSDVARTIGRADIAGRLAMMLADETGSISFGANASLPIARIVSPLPADEEVALATTLGYIDNGEVPSGPLATKWGTQYKDWLNDLPGASGPASPYLEYRVLVAGSSGAGPLRVVVNSETGEMYYTWTHYGDAGSPAFVKIR